jgi:hypothetical protein
VLVVVAGASGVLVEELVSVAELAGAVVSGSPATPVAGAARASTHRPPSSELRVRVGVFIASLSCRAGS